MKTTIREYAEGLPVKIIELNGRLVIEALNEDGHNGTEVDLTDVINWIKSNRPDLLTEAK